MKQKVLDFIKFLILFTIVIGGIQYLIVEFLMEKQEYYYNTFAIYAFLFSVTLLLYLAVCYINTVFHQYTGYAFMAGGVLKMIFSVLFLLPMILSNERSYVADVLVFFVPYFLYLLFETIFAVQLLKDKTQETA